MAFWCIFAVIDGKKLYPSIRVNVTLIELITEPREMKHFFYNLIMFIFEDMSCIFLFKKEYSAIMLTKVKVDLLIHGGLVTLNIAITYQVGHFCLSRRPFLFYRSAIFVLTFFLRVIRKMVSYVFAY